MGDQLLPFGRDDVAFVYEGFAVGMDDRKFIDMTAMWEAAGRDESKRPYEWGRKSGSGFIASLARNLNTPRERIWKSKRGQHNGGVWAHWQVALAYAKYLSHELHRAVNEAFREWVEEKVDPDLKVKRAIDGYRRKGWDDRKIAERIDGIVDRKMFTGTLQTHGVEGKGYALCTDAINREVLGAGAKEIKLARGVPVKAPTRDHLESYELAGLRFAEAMAAKKIEDGCAHGSGQCCAICREAGSVVGTAMEKMGLRRVGA